MTLTPDSRVHTDPALPAQDLRELSQPSDFTRIDFVSNQTLYSVTTRQSNDSDVREVSSEQSCGLILSAP